MGFGHFPVEKGYLEVNAALSLPVLPTPQGQPKALTVLGDDPLRLDPRSWGPTTP